MEAEGWSQMSDWCSSEHKHWFLNAIVLRWNGMVRALLGRSWGKEHHAFKANPYGETSSLELAAALSLSTWGHWSRWILLGISIRQTIAKPPFRSVLHSHELLQELHSHSSPSHVQAMWLRSPSFSFPNLHLRRGFGILCRFSCHHCIELGWVWPSTYQNKELSCHDDHGRDHARHRSLHQSWLARGASNCSSFLIYKWL